MENSIIMKSISEEFGRVVRLATQEEIAKLGVKNPTEYNVPGTKLDISAIREFVRQEDEISRASIAEFLKYTDSDLSEVPTSSAISTGAVKATVIQNLKSAWILPSTLPSDDVGYSGGYSLAEVEVNTSTNRITGVVSLDWEAPPILIVGTHVFQPTSQTPTFPPIPGAPQLVVLATGDIWRFIGEYPYLVVVVTTTRIGYHNAQ
jgi:hypothetical protein